MCFWGGGGVAGDEVAGDEVAAEFFFFFFAVLFVVVGPGFAGGEGGGGRSPLIKKIMKIAISCMPRFFGRRARDAARGRGDNLFSFPFSF